MLFYAINAMAFTPPPSTDQVFADYSVYHMDEASWSGVNGEVLNSPGTVNGTAAGLNNSLPTTASKNPAIAGSRNLEIVFHSAGILRSNHGVDIGPVRIRRKHVQFCKFSGV